MRPLRAAGRRLQRDMPVLRIPFGKTAHRLAGHAILQRVQGLELNDKPILDPPPDLVEIAEALDIMAKPYVGSGWANLNFDGLPCTTPRQEAIWMEYNGITRGED